MLRITATSLRILSGVLCGQDGDQLTYYALGNCEPKGSFKVGQVTHAEKNVKLKSKGNAEGVVDDRLGHLEKWLVQLVIAKQLSPDAVSAPNPTILACKVA